MYFQHFGKHIFDTSNESGKSIEFIGRPNWILFLSKMPSLPTNFTQRYLLVNLFVSFLLQSYT